MIVHVLTMLPTTRETILFAKYHKIIKTFLWKEGKVIIANTNLSKDIAHKGLKLSDLVVQTKAQTNLDKRLFIYDRGGMARSI